MKLFFLIILLSCSGYQLRRRSNPLKKYDIGSISVPSFYNETALPNLSHYFTMYFTEEMYKVKGLEVRNSWESSSDSYLIGVIKGDKEHAEIFERDLSNQINIISPQNAPQNKNIVPITNKVNFSINLYLVKNPGVFKKLLGKGLSYSNLSKHPGVVMHRRMNVNIDNIAREINDGKDFVINTTQNERLLEKVLKKKAKEIALDFSNTYFYEF